MLFLFWSLLVLTGACLFLLMPALLGWPVYARYRGVRVLTCPQTHGSATVRLDALHAATTAVFATEKLRLAACSLWPERAACAQGCIGDAVALPAVVRITAKPPAIEALARINYVAVLVSAAAYWLVGAFWYSHYMFRETWMQLMGYSDASVKEMVLLSVPQVETLLWSLCYAFLMAWIIEGTRRHSARLGAEVGFLLWIPVWIGIVATILYRGLPIQLVWIHADAALIASLIAGFIIGVWTPGRIVKALDGD
jgi:hypothetical protein